MAKNDVIFSYDDWQIHREDAYKWYRSLSINEQKTFEKKYHGVLAEYTSKSSRMITEMYFFEVIHKD
jgi:hypothetical protein